jgi:membrane protease YdiL (CAAX protease family)
MDYDIRAAIHRHEVIAFVVLTLTFSWGWWILVPQLVGADGLSRGLVIPGAFGPVIAAGIVVRLSGGSLRAWASQALRWRVPPRWYLAAIGIPIGIILVGVGGALLVAGGPVEFSVVPQRLTLFVATFLVATLIGGGQEEFGWRGFALPRLQDSYSALTASLAIGVVWAVWHLPVFMLGAPRNQSGNFLLYTVLVIGLSILLTWQYNSTGGSVLLAMFLHGGINASGTLLPAPMAAVSE